MQPKYEHDCATCEFLGRHEGEDADLYSCAGINWVTLVARYADEGSEYSSVSIHGRVLTLRDHELYLLFKNRKPEPTAMAEAYRLAHGRGHFTLADGVEL